MIGVIEKFCNPKNSYAGREIETACDWGLILGLGLTKKLIPNLNQTVYKVPSSGIAKLNSKGV